MIGWIILGLIILSIFSLIIFGLVPSQAQRQVGFSEGIDDAAVGKAFNFMQNLPQFKLLRNIIIQRIIKPKIGNFLVPGASLLDLGCGTGHLLKDIHTKIKHRKLSKIKLNGLDLSAESVRLCKENFAKAGINDIEIREGDGAKMPYSDESMDIIVTSLSLHHWVDPIPIFNEIFRVLRSEGVLILFDMRRDCHRGWHWFIKFITRIIVPKPLREVKEPLGSLLASYTKDELQGILKATKWIGKRNRIDSFLFAQILEIRK
jgi:ubiquinone/menaquinone biosynthesis C-methylase UbiE